LARRPRDKRNKNCHIEQNEKADIKAENTGQSISLQIYFYL
jgi:hypothetical protein